MNQRNMIASVVVALAVLLPSTGIAGVTTLEDEVTFLENCPDGLFIMAPNGKNYSHDVTSDPDYSPGLVVANGELKVWLSDTCGGSPYVVTVLYDGTSWGPCQFDQGSYSTNVTPGVLTNGCLPVQISSDFAWLQCAKLTLWCNSDDQTPPPPCPPVVPAPGAVLLAGVGAGVVGWLRRRNTL